MIILCLIQVESQDQLEDMFSDPVDEVDMSDGHEDDLLAAVL